MNHYFRNTLLITLVITGMIASVSWFMNPYQIFNPPLIKNINAVITESYYKQLVFKPYQLRHINPSSVIIGASHAGIAFNPDNLSPPAYNFSIGGATSYINYRLLQETLHTNSALQTVILETPFFGYNSSDAANIPEHDTAFELRLGTRANGQTNRLQSLAAMNDRLSTLLSWDSIRASMRMLSKQSSVAGNLRGSYIQKRNGQWIQQPPPNATTAKLFENSLKKFIYNEWFPPPAKMFTLDVSSSAGPFAYYRESLQLLYSHNVHTSIVIAPLHGSLLIALRDSGLWPAFNTWKQALVLINQQEAAKASRHPFIILDYAVINDHTSEPLPDDQASTQRLIWFNDSAHASPQFGDIVLQEIQTRKALVGVPLTPDNIEEHLTRSEAALMRYIHAHPTQQAVIQKLIAQAPADIHFPPKPKD